MHTKDVILVVGPTASGKSAAAVEIAKVIGGEIISADSMQIYKSMDIGTAKPTPAEMQGVPHHLVSEIEPDTPYSVSLFQQRCFALIGEISGRGKVPVIAGGTGLYINAVVYELDFTQTAADDAYREKLARIAREEGTAALHRLLAERSPEDAARIHPNDQKRIIRRLEILHGQKEKRAYNFLKRREDYNFIMIGLTMERAELYRRIEARVDDMVKAGLVEEVAALYKRYGPGLQSLQGIGYKEMIAAVTGLCTVEEAVLNIKKATRNFAKRQLTWFRRDERIKWYDIADYQNRAEMLADIIVYIRKRMHTGV